MNAIQHPLNCEPAAGSKVSGLPADVSTKEIMAERLDTQSRPTGTPPSCDAAPRATVLLVDDDESVRKLVLRFLSLSGFHVLSAESGPAAFPLWQEHKDSIDLLLTDLVMPGGIGGFDLAARLRTERPNLRVLFTSGYDAETAGDDGAHRVGLQFLQKPYRPEQLLAAVRAAIVNLPDPVEAL
jgi:two-component system, cell cycle sensor histidine kinase and response regulator CckA